MLSRGGRDGAEVERRIRAAIDELRPLLRFDAAGVELLGFDVVTGVATMRLAGDCPECELSVGMLAEGIAAHLRMRVPEIREIHQVTANDDE